MANNIEAHDCKHELMYQCHHCGVLQCTRCGGQFDDIPTSIEVAASMWTCGECIDKPEQDFILKDMIEERMNEVAGNMDESLKKLGIDPDKVKPKGMRSNR